MMREKRRYLLSHLESKVRHSEDDARRMVSDAVLQLFGEQGVSRARLSLKAFDAEKQLLLVRCSLASSEKVMAALALKTVYRTERLALRLAKVFGTLRKARDFFPEAAFRKGKKP